MPQCGIVALDCCFALFVVCLIGCYYIFKRNFICSCATKPTPKIYEYMLTYTHMPIYFRLLASYKRSRLPFHLSQEPGQQATHPFFQTHTLPVLQPPVLPKRAQRKRGRKGQQGHQVHRGNLPRMEPGPPPTTPDQTPAAGQEVTKPQSPFLTGQGLGTRAFPA